METTYIKYYEAIFAGLYSKYFKYTGTIDGLQEYVELKHGKLIDEHKVFYYYIQLIKEVICPLNIGSIVEYDDDSKTQPTKIEYGKTTFENWAFRGSYITRSDYNSDWSSDSSDDEAESDIKICTGLFDQLISGLLSVEKITVKDNKGLQFITLPEETNIVWKIKTNKSKDDHRKSLLCTECKKYKEIYFTDKDFINLINKFATLSVTKHLINKLYEKSSIPMNQLQLSGWLEMLDNTLEGLKKVVETENKGIKEELKKGKELIQNSLSLYSGYLEFFKSIPKTTLDKLQDGSI